MICVQIAPYRYKTKPNKDAVHPCKPSDLWPLTSDPWPLTSRQSELFNLSNIRMMLKHKIGYKDQSSTPSRRSSRTARCTHHFKTMSWTHHKRSIVDASTLRPLRRSAVISYERLNSSREQWAPRTCFLIEVLHAIVSLTSNWTFSLSSVQCGHEFNWLELLVWYSMQNWCIWVALE